MFVHIRNKEYLAQGHSVEVLVPSNKVERYEVDGVCVTLDNVQALEKKLAGADRVMIHLLYHRLDRATDASVLYSRILKERCPTVFFIHGVETQTIWNSRRDDIKWYSPTKIARWLYRDLFLIKKMIATLRDFNQKDFPCKFVTPSKWMLQESIRLTDVKLTKKALIIPNGIDTEHFTFDPKWERREHLLSIRPLIYHGKYAIDLLIEAMSKLNIDSSLTLYGRGPDERLIRDTARSQLKLVQFILNAQFIDHSEIPSIHAKHGVYLAVTRMDAQGVSMCEAMASGLPTVSFATCAIPEFVQHGKTGLLASCYDTTEFSNCVYQILDDRALFDKLSINARKAIEKIDIRETVSLELGNYF